jgi:2'-hydroxyisoflavone reductase
VTRCLVIGGRQFVGPAIVERCLSAGIEVTLFCRGQTNPSLFDELDVVLGDRVTDLGRLGDRRFDFVIDTCGYRPEVVAISARHLASRADVYVFISTASVYGELAGASRITEDHPVATLGDEPRDAPENYGPLKALCEAAVIEAFAAGALILRPGLIAGPRDPTDRFTYWPVRLSRGGRALVPGDGLDPMQVIDVADVAELAVEGGRRQLSGVFNVAGPARPTRFRDFIGEIATVCGGDDLELGWVGTSFLLESDVAPWSDLPCWLPRSSEDGGMLRLDVSRALATGIWSSLTPVAELAAKTLAWHGGRPLRAGLEAARERELLRDWRRSRPRSRV